MLNRTCSSLAVIAFSLLAFTPLPAGAQNARPAPAPIGPPASARDAGTAIATTTHTVSQGVAATVNDTIITDYDVNQRVGLFVVTTGINPTSDTLEQVRKQVIRSMVDEALEQQQIEKYKVKTEPGEVETAMKNIAAQNDTTLDQLTDQLKSAHIDIATLRSEIATQIAWNKLVQGRYLSQLNVTDDDVSQEMDRIKASADKPQFLVSELFLGVDVPEQDAQVKASAQQIMQQIELGAPFTAAARQLSQSPSAANGGDIGWVTEGQLPDELNKALEGLRVGQMAGPIRSAGGYYVLLLRDRREPAGTVVPKQPATPASTDGAIPLARLLLPLPPNPDKDLRSRALQAGLSIRQRIKSCDDGQTVAKQVHGSVFMNLGDMKPGELSKEVRDVLAHTQSGEVAPPFISPAGVEIIIRCDPPVRRIVPFEMPTRAEVEDQLYSERVAIMARSYLRDLRRDAVVQIR